MMTDLPAPPQAGPVHYCWCDGGLVRCETDDGVETAFHEQCDGTGLADHAHYLPTDRILRQLLARLREWDVAVDADMLASLADRLAFDVFHVVSQRLDNEITDAFTDDDTEARRKAHNAAYLGTSKLKLPPAFPPCVRCNATGTVGADTCSCCEGRAFHLMTEDRWEHCLQGHADQFRYLTITHGGDTDADAIGQIEAMCHRLRPGHRIRVDTHGDITQIGISPALADTVPTADEVIDRVTDLARELGGDRWDIHDRRHQGGSQ